jgi:hypothetical protein
MRPFRCIVAALLSVTTISSATGCSTWRLETAPLPDVIARRPESLQVRTADSTVVIRRPSLRADTLSGFTADQAAPAHFLATDVRSVSTRRTSAAKTALLTVGLVIGIGLAAYAAACGNASCE